MHIHTYILIYICIEGLYVYYANRCLSISITQYLNLCFSLPIPMSILISIHISINRYTHTYILTYIHTHIHASMHACMHTCMHTYINVLAGALNDTGVDLRSHERLPNSKRS